MGAQATAVMLGLVLLMHGVSGCASTGDPGQPTSQTSAGSDPGETAPAGQDTAAAAWKMARRQAVGGSQVTVLVTRVSCNSGVTGDILPPDVVAEGEQTVITFVVAPGEPAAATCQGNNWVRYQLDLGEQWASSTLVDGQCLADGEAVGTSFCTGGGIQHRATN